MTPRDAINFVRTPLGAFISFLVLLVIAYIIVISARDKAPATIPVDPHGSKATGDAQMLYSINRNMSPLQTPASQEEKVKSPPPERNSDQGLPPLSLFGAGTEPSAPPEGISGVYAPFGRLIRCQLIVTVDSSSISTPIIGLVTDDVFHNGELVIPAGTEVHGTASLDHVRERISSTGRWTLVWQTGEELTLDGIALDREDELEEGSWSITDGSAGLRGRILKSDEFAEAKLFAASFLSGAASSLTEREQTLFGSRPTSSLQNAPFEGSQQVLNAYAKQIYDTIQREGYYVRVPAGKQFYLYATEPVELSRSMIGTTRNPNHRPGNASPGTP